MARRGQALFAVECELSSIILTASSEASSYRNNLTADGRKDHGLTERVLHLSCTQNENIFTCPYHHGLALTTIGRAVLQGRRVPPP